MSDYYKRLFLSSLISSSSIGRNKEALCQQRTPPNFWQDVWDFLSCFSAQLVLKLDGENASTCSKILLLHSPFWFLKEQKKDKKDTHESTPCFQYFAPIHSFTVCYTRCSKGGSLFCFLLRQVNDHWIGRRPPIHVGLIHWIGSQ